MPPKAFSVLQFLVANAGKLVTHNELMEKVWPDTFVQPEVLSSHIRDVRAALGDSARKPRFIETVSRRGYRFITKVDHREVVNLQQTSNSSGNLVGRDSAFAKLNQCYRAVLTGIRQLVFVTGEPGMGKTALCREFLRQAQGLGASYTTWGYCIEGYGVQEPYFPILKAIGDLCRDGGKPIVEIFKMKAPTCIVQFSDLISREERAALDPDVRSATSGRMLREVLDALESVGESRPLILVLDDLQWVDRASVDVISEFARRHTPARVMLVGTFRPLEAFLNGNPIAVLKEELLARRLCTEISLSGLTQSDVVEYISQLTSQPELRTELANLLYRRSEGNPLFMVAALEHSLEQGLLVKEAGELLLRTPLDQLDMDIPLSLKRVLEAQIDTLETRERRILEVASVEGSVFSPAVIAPATDHTYQEVEDICHQLAIRNQILRAAPEHQLPNGSTVWSYQFVHVLYRDVLYDRQSPGRKSTRHKLIGIQLEEIHKGHLEEVAAEIALHFEHASDWKRTVHYLRLAAENSERRYAHREAIALLKRARELVTRISEVDSRRIELEILERLATLYVACFDPRCVEAYEGLYERASAYGHAEVCARALLNLAGCLLTQDGQRSFETARRASEVIATLPDSLLRTRMEMTCNFIFACTSGWDPVQADQLRQSFRRIREQVDPAELAPQTIQYGIIQWASSEYQESLESLIEGLTALSKQASEGDPFLSIDYQRAHFYLPRALLFVGEWGQALDALDRSLVTSVKNGDTFAAKILRLNRAWVYFHARDFHEVIATSESLEQIGEEFSSSAVARMARILSGSAHVALGNRDHGSSMLMKIQSEMAEGLMVLDWCFRLPLLSALTELWLSEGNLGEAETAANLFLSLALTTEKHTYSALALEASARVALAQGNLVSAASFVSDALRLIGEYQIPLAAWRVHAVASQLHMALDDRGLAQTHQDAANAAILTLANSLSPEHPLRKKFLASALVAKVLVDDHEYQRELAMGSL